MLNGTSPAHVLPVTSAGRVPANTTPRYGRWCELNLRHGLPGRDVAGPATETDKKEERR